MKKRHHQEMSAEQRSDLFEAEHGLSIEALREKIRLIEESGSPEKIWQQAKYVITDFSPVQVKAKHSVGIGGCTGTIDASGKCRECGEFTPGVLCYSFTMYVRDIKKPELKLKLACAEGAGNSLFKMSAAEFNALDANAVDDVLEKCQEVPILSGIMLKHNMDKMETFALAYNCIFLPPSALD